MDLHSAVLAHFMLKERLRRLGILGCISCIIGSVVIVIHAPEERMPTSVQEIWNLATQPGHHPAKPFLHAMCFISFSYPDELVTDFFLVAYFNSISNLCSINVVNSAHIDIAFRASLWSNKLIGLLGHLFLNGFTYGNCLFFFTKIEIIHCVCGRIAAVFLALNCFLSSQGRVGM